MADMQSGIGPFVGIFLLSRGWHSGLIGTAMTCGNVAGMLITIPIGGLIDTTNFKRAWVIVPGICVVGASALILLSQNFWIVAGSQIATAIAGAAIVPAVTGITLGIVRQRGFNRQIGRNQAFNHAGNMVGAALSGYLGWTLGYTAVFGLAAAFGIVSVICVLMIPAAAIDHRAARGSREQGPDSQPSAWRVLLTHKPLLVLSMALAAFHLGNASIVALYGLAAIAGDRANGPGFVATTVVVAQAVMVIASIVAMRVAEKKGYWPILLLSFTALPVRGVLAYFFVSWWGMISVQILDGVGAGLQSVAVPGVVARSHGTGRINLGQGAVLTVQGIGASLSPILGGWIAQIAGYGAAFLLLGSFGLIAVGLWIAFAPALKHY